MVNIVVVSFINPISQVQKSKLETLSVAGSNVTETLLSIAGKACSEHWWCWESKCFGVRRHPT